MRRELGWLRGLRRLGPTGSGRLSRKRVPWAIPTDAEALTRQMLTLLPAETGAPQPCQLAGWGWAQTPAPPPNPDLGLIARLWDLSQGQAWPYWRRLKALQGSAARELWRAGDLVVVSSLS